MLGLLVLLRKLDKLNQGFCVLSWRNAGRILESCDQMSALAQSGKKFRRYILNKKANPLTGVQYATQAH